LQIEMEIKRIKIKELSELIYSEWYKNSEHLPISPERVISQIHNPFAHSEDEVLYLLLKDNILVAYRLVLPSYVGDQKMAWLSCVWVHPNHRRKGYGVQLTKLALEFWNNKMLGTNFTPESRTMYQDKLHFSTSTILKGNRYYNQLYLSELLPKKKPILRWIKPILLTVDFIGNQYLKRKKKINIDSQISIQRLEFIDKESLEFIAPYQTKEQSSRTKEEWDWIVKYPWVVQGSQNSISKRYHFSNRSNSFDFHLYKVFKNKNLIGCLWITIHDGFLKTPYLYFKKENTNYILKLIIKLAQENNVKAITTFDVNLNQLMTQEKKYFHHQKSITRHFLSSKGLKISNERFFKEGDGDSVFT